jgi:glucosamine--fructose-6-phosphate aminotransferase (isomerizing)
LTLLFKYLSGRLPLPDFEMDFGLKGTAKNVLNTFFRVLGESINLMSRPVDAIKHQAKTVTVGTSRISERVEGILFDTLFDACELDIAQVINRNVIVLKNIQAVVDHVKGSILYRIDDLDLLGDPTDQTTITILKKTGILAELPSRVETDNVLKGTKRIIVRQGNIYIGKGRKDDRSIVVIPATSEDPTDGSRIRYLLLLNIGFKESISLEKKDQSAGRKIRAYQKHRPGKQHPLGRQLPESSGRGRLVRPVSGKTGRRHGGALWLRMEVGRLNTRKSLAD